MGRFNISRGEVYWIESKKNERGAEIRKTRPGVIVSNNRNNGVSPVVSVVYMTSTPKSESPSHVVSEGTDLGKCVGSTIICEQINTISKERVLQEEGYMGRLSEREMALIDEGLMEALGIDFESYESDVESFLGEDEQAEDCMCKELEQLRVERDFFKEKYHEIIDRIMAKANI